ncbi:MAG: DUF3500 domain-containing protein [Methyloligellaceae bacterium]
MRQKIKVICLLLSILSVSSAHAHKATDTTVNFVTELMKLLTPEEAKQLSFSFEDRERFNFFWTPGSRKGLTLGEMEEKQKEALKHVFQTILSDKGQKQVDAIIAAEAALGVIEDSRNYRNPDKYYITIFGTPSDSATWGLRFEGHHLSINMTFQGNTIISASPLFIGTNPETIPAGPDKGLRPLKGEVDLAFKLYNTLSAKEREIARGSREWFGGFLTSPGERRASLGKPAGIEVSKLPEKTQERVKDLIAVYVGTFSSRFSEKYLQEIYEKELPYLRFYWSGGEKPNQNYYYRIAGKKLLIEHDAMSRGTHIHAAWRDLDIDFGR